MEEGGADSADAAATAGADAAAAQRAGSSKQGGEWLGGMLSRARVATSTSKKETSGEFQQLRDELRRTRALVVDIEKECDAYRKAAHEFSGARARFQTAMTRACDAKQVRDFVGDATLSGLLGAETQMGPAVESHGGAITARLLTPFRERLLPAIERARALKAETYLAVVDRNALAERIDALGASKRMDSVVKSALAQSEHSQCAARFAALQAETTDAMIAVERDFRGILAAALAGSAVAEADALTAAAQLLRAAAEGAQRRLVELGHGAEVAAAAGPGATPGTGSAAAAAAQGGDSGGGGDALASARMASLARKQQLSGGGVGGEGGLTGSSFASGGGTSSPPNLSGGPPPHQQQQDTGLLSSSRSASVSFALEALGAAGEADGPSNPDLPAMGPGEAGAGGGRSSTTGASQQPPDSPSDRATRMRMLLSRGSGSPSPMRASTLGSGPAGAAGEPAAAGGGGGGARVNGPVRGGGGGFPQQQPPEPGASSSSAAPSIQRTTSSGGPGAGGPGGMGSVAAASPASGAPYAPGPGGGGSGLRRLPVYLPAPSVPMLPGEATTARAEGVVHDASGEVGLLVATNYRLRWFPARFIGVAEGGGGSGASMEGGASLAGMAVVKEWGGGGPQGGGSPSSSSASPALGAAGGQGQQAGGLKRGAAVSGGFSAGTGAPGTGGGISRAPSDAGGGSSSSASPGSAGAAAPSAAPPPVLQRAHSFFDLQAEPLLEVYVPAGPVHQFGPPAPSSLSASSSAVSLPTLLLGGDEGPAAAPAAPPAPALPPNGPRRPRVPQTSAMGLSPLALTGIGGGAPGSVPAPGGSGTDSQRELLLLGAGGPSSLRSPSPSALRSPTRALAASSSLPLALAASASSAPLSQSAAQADRFPTGPAGRALSAQSVGEYVRVPCLSLPLSCLSRLEVVGGAKGSLVVAATDFRVVSFGFALAAGADALGVHAALSEHTWIPVPVFHLRYKLDYLPLPPGTQAQMLLVQQAAEAGPAGAAEALLLSPPSGAASPQLTDGWGLFTFPSEWRRMTALTPPASRGLVRVSLLNTGYRLCATYPELLMVPSSVSDGLVSAAAKYRSKRRLPAVTWFHGSITLSRASQPLAGMFNSRSADDEKLLGALASSPATDPVAAAALAAAASAPLPPFGLSRAEDGSTACLAVFDARPRLNALGNRTKGGGSESIVYYPGCSLTFLGIDNIHVVRDALKQMRARLQSDRSRTLHRAMEAAAAASYGDLDALAAAGHRGAAMGGGMLGAGGAASQPTSSPAPFSTSASAEARAAAGAEGEEQGEGGGEEALAPLSRVGSLGGPSAPEPLAYNAYAGEDGTDVEAVAPSPSPTPGGPPAKGAAPPSSPSVQPIVAPTAGAGGKGFRSLLRRSLGGTGGGTAADTLGTGAAGTPAPGSPVLAGGSGDGGSGASPKPSFFGSLGRRPGKRGVSPGSSSSSSGSPSLGALGPAGSDAPAPLSPLLLANGALPPQQAQVATSSSGGNVVGSLVLPPLLGAGGGLPGPPLLWTRLVAILLRGGVACARHLGAGVSVFVHCSDGWDRTAGLTSLAQIMVDPFYRTLPGFAILVEKEWCAFGHRFAKRCGTGGCGYDRTAHDDDQRAPIFLQWLDAVWQVWRQRPSAFQFNERVLMGLAEHAYSGRFGTFLFDCEKDRTEARLPELSVSIWTYMLHPTQRPRFSNPLYAPPPTMVLGEDAADIALGNGGEPEGEPGSGADADGPGAPGRAARLAALGALMAGSIGAVGGAGIVAAAPVGAASPYRALAFRLGEDMVLPDAKDEALALWPFWATKFVSERTYGS